VGPASGSTYLRIERELRHDLAKRCKIPLVVKSREVMKEFKSPHDRLRSGSISAD